MRDRIGFPVTRMTALLVAVVCFGCAVRNPTFSNGQILTPVVPGSTVAIYECTASVSTRSIQCEPPTPAFDADPQLALLGRNQVKLTSSNVHYDPATLIFGFDVRLKNLLAEPIGTPDGVTVAGNRIVYEKGPAATSFTAPSDTGTVSVNNPGGFGDFTAPHANQPYHLYKQIVLPGDSTPNQRWELKVPRSVSEFSFSMRVLTALPSEYNGASSRPPAYTPEWAFHPDSSARCVPITGGLCNRRLVRVFFQPGATADQRQAAVAAVGGVVVGGSPLGYYYVRIGGDGTLATLSAAIVTLRALSQVQRAFPFDTTPVSLDGQAPADGRG